MMVGDNLIIKIGHVSVNYIQYGEGPDIVLLHGWGQNIEMMEPLGSKLLNSRITILDLPGFGKSSEPDTVWNIEDYTEFLKEFLIKVHVLNPTLIGHSFGGRIAICYSAKYKVNKVVLFGSPCIREKKELSFKEKTLKKLKKIPGLNILSELAKNYIGSTDYKQATPRMRDILVRVINQDLSNYAALIKVPTLLIWGDLDVSAPLEDAKKLEQIIPDAGLVILPGKTHYAYLEDLSKVTTILTKFL